MKPLFVFSLTAILSACGSLPKPGQAPALYDFGISPEAQSAPVAVKLTRVEAAPGLESLAMRYRLAYQNPAQVFTYTESRWAAAPADLLAQRLRQQGFSPAASPCTLRVTLETFDQVFDSSTSSHGIVALRAELIADSGRQSTAQTTWINAKAAALTTDAKGGVAAITAATDEAAKKLGNWVKDQACATGPGKQ